jgi:hypothetical protein
MNKKLPLLFVIILSFCCCVSSIASESANLTTYALVKENICIKHCNVDDLDGYVKRPQKGFVFSEGALNAQYPRRYSVIDFEHLLLTHIDLQYDYKTEKTSLVKKETAKLSIICANQLLETTNKIWASKAWLEVNMIMDVGWSLNLLDAKTVRKEGGPGTPSGLAVTLSQQLNCR